ncbi:MAG: hypothetical protein LBN43_06060 [Oscillospiraceae bacterium]|jgi:vacuolar-type H+-ATPase subunit H|nr:hypothetical protein [Oscillospiraceae bacterium]
MEVFGTINSAEAEAKKIRLNAERDAASDKERALADGRTLIENAVASARASVDNLMKQSALVAEKEAESLARTTGNRKAILRDRVEKKLEAASDFIVESMVNG